MREQHETARLGVQDQIAVEDYVPDRDLDSAFTAFHFFSFMPNVLRPPTDRSRGVRRLPNDWFARVARARASHPLGSRRRIVLLGVLRNNGSLAPLRAGR